MLPEFLILPIWAYGYCLLLCGAFIAAFLDERISSKLNFKMIAGHFCTLSVSVFCILAYCHPALAAPLYPPLLLAIVLFSLMWDYSQSIQDAKIIEAELKQDGMITDTERDAVIKTGMAVGALIILPAYMMGLKVWFDLVIQGLKG